MSNEIKNALAWWDYANFHRVIKFVESIYPRSPKLKDKIAFWKQEGSRIIEPKKLNQP